MAHRCASSRARGPARGQVVTNDGVKIDGAICPFAPGDDDAFDSDVDLLTGAQAAAEAAGVGIDTNRSETFDQTNAGQSLTC